jgi:hypothetical protein
MEILVNVNLKGKIALNIEIIDFIKEDTIINIKLVLTKIIFF